MAAQKYSQKINKKSMYFIRFINIPTRLILLPSDRTSGDGWQKAQEKQNTGFRFKSGMTTLLSHYDASTFTKVMEHKTDDKQITEGG